MTIKQCYSCKYFICVKELGERCWRLSNVFMKNKNCQRYEYGKINQEHKEYFQEIGEEYPFTELK